MKLKYYLRGLGVGIVVTTLILLIVFNTTGKNISDDEIKARAKELGMIETQIGDTPDSGKLLDTFGKDNTDDGTSDNSADTTTDSSDVVDESDDNVNDSTAVDTSDDTDTSDEVETNDETDDSVDNTNNNNIGSDDEHSTTDDGETDNETIEEVKNPNLLQPGQRAKISVVPGDVSRTVADKLYEAGLIVSSEEFNKFMQDTGSDDYIKVGDYNIVAGATYDEIASILTR